MIIFPAIDLKDGVCVRLKKGVMEDATVKKRLGDGGVEVAVSKSPEDFSAFVKAENERWAKVIKDAGVVAE